MKTKFYDQPKLEGDYIELGYGSYVSYQIAVLPNGVQSINIPPKVRVTLFSQDNLAGYKYIIPNTGNKNLKVPGFITEFPYTVLSIKIDCACNVEINPYVNYQIIPGKFTRPNGVLTAYTFYNVIPAVAGPGEPPLPYNPTVFIIPDFATDRTIYAPIQEELAQRRFSSIVLDLRGVGETVASLSGKYADIIQDYRYIGNKLGQFAKKPIVMGIGVGGAIVQLWSLTYKVELRNLILIDTAPYSVYSNYNTLNTAIYQWIGGNISTKEFSKIVVDKTYNTESKGCKTHKLKLDLADSIEDCDAATVQRLFTQNPTDPSMATAPKFIITPTLIIHGTDDIVIPMSAASTLHNLIPGSKLIKLPTNHMPLLTMPKVAIGYVFNYLSPSGSLYIDP